MQSELIGTYSRKLGLPQNLGIIKKASEFYTRLTSESNGLLSSTNVSTSCLAVVCLHLSANHYDQTVDNKLIHKLAGISSRAKYVAFFQNVESKLNLSRPLTIEEVCTKLGCAHLRPKALKVFSDYRKSVLQDLEAVRHKDMNFDKPLYVCASVAVACKLEKQAMDKEKLLAMSMTKKSDFDRVVKASLEVQQLQRQKAATPAKKSMHKSLLESIVSKSDDVAAEECSPSKRVRRRRKEDDDDDYETWKQEMLKEAGLA